jgi:hypothetical protein
MKAIKDELGEFVRKEVGREPMVVPMYVYITKNGLPEKKAVRADDVSIDPAGMTIEEQ